MSEYDERLDDIADFLEKNGSSIMAQLIYDIKSIHNLRNRFTMLLVPTDSAIQRLIKRTGKSIVEIKENEYAVQILKNHISVLPTKKTEPMFTAITGLTFGRSPVDLQKLHSRSNAQISGVAVIIIDRILYNEGQLENLKDSR